MDNKTTVQVNEEDLKAMRKLTTGSKKGTDPEKFHDLIDKYKKEVIDAKETPDFLFSGKAGNRDVYRYLKENPKSAQFIYDNYPGNQSFIRTLCDERNTTLYLPKVAKELGLVVDIKGYEDQLSELRRTIQDKQQERNSLAESIAPMEAEYDELEKNLKGKKIELETLETQVTNLHGTEGLGKVKSYMKQVQDFIQATYNDRNNQSPSELSGEYGRFEVHKEKFKALLNDGEKLELYLKADQFTKEDIENSKSELAKIKEQIQLEIEQAKKELESITYMNPMKKLFSTWQGLKNSNDFLENSFRVTSTNDRYMAITDDGIRFNEAKENLIKCQNIVGDLYNQLDRLGEDGNEDGSGEKKRRKWGKKEVE